MRARDCGQILSFVSIAVSVILLTFLCESVQAAEGVRVSCRSSLNCSESSDDEIGIMTARECCVENSNGLAFTTTSQQSETHVCTACIVFGFLNDTFVGLEQGPNHKIPVGFSKGATQAQKKLEFTVTASIGTPSPDNTDYTLITRSVEVFYDRPGPSDNVEISLLRDNLAQEANETVKLHLHRSGAGSLPSGEGVFFRNSIDIIIIDSDIVKISFTEGDYRTNEMSTTGEDGISFMPVTVMKTTKIATPIILEVVPLTMYQANLSLLPSITVLEENPLSPTFADWADFSNATIQITFEPEGDSQNKELTVSIPIFDDDVNEAEEQIFVIQLQLVSAVNKERITFTRQASLCRIVNNDAIRIGFELGSYTYLEPKFEETIDASFVATSTKFNGPIFLVKENNKTSEQTFFVVVQVASGSVPGQDIQPAILDKDYQLSSSGSHIVLQFLSSAWRLNIPFTLFPDDLLEDDEAFLLSMSPNVQQGGREFSNPLNLTVDCFVIIKDDDGAISGSGTTDIEPTTSVTSTTTTVAVAHEISTTTSDGATTTVTSSPTTRFTTTTVSNNDDITTTTVSGPREQTSTTMTSTASTPTSNPTTINQMEATTDSNEISGMENEGSTTMYRSLTTESIDITPSEFSCDRFSIDLEQILFLTGESQMPTLDNITEAVEQLAHITGTETVAECSHDNITNNFYIVSRIFGNIAKFIENHPDERFTFNSSIISGLTRTINSLLDWPSGAIKPDASSKLLRSYEIISSAYAQQLTNGSKQVFNFSSITLVIQRNDVEDLQQTEIAFKPDSTNKTFVADTHSIPSSEFLVNSPDTRTDVDKNSIVLPGSVFEKASSTNNNSKTSNTIGTVFTLYKTATLFPVGTQSRDNLTRTLVGSKIIAANLGKKVEDLDDPVKINLQLENPAGMFLLPGSEVCVSWDFTLQDWTDRGCNTTAQPNGAVSCSCSHLTNFAVLMDVCLRREDCEPINKDVDFALSFISYIGIAISIVCLLLTIITMLAFKEMRKRDTSKYHIQLCVALLLMLIVSLALIATGSQAMHMVYAGCVSISVLVHYFALVAVMWMGAEALLMFQKVVIIFIRVSKKYIIAVSLICWLIPLVPVLITLIIDLVKGSDPESDLIVRRAENNSFCFLSHPGAFWGGFLAPILLIITLNIVAFICVLFVLLRQVKRRSQSNGSMRRKISTISAQNTQIKEETANKRMGYKKALFLMIRISGVMSLFGLSWLFAILTFVSVTGLQETFQILFTVFNSFQGCFIFIFLCVMDKRIRRSWKRFLNTRILKKTPLSQSGLDSTTNGYWTHSRDSTRSRSFRLTTINSNADIVLPDSCTLPQSSNSNNN